MDSLPNELLINIFEYLSPSDRLEVSTVSRHWFVILQLPTFAKDNHILLNECIINKKHPPFKTFCNTKRSHRTFPYLTLNNIKFDHNNATDLKTFFKKVGKDVHYLRIHLDFDLVKFPTVIKFFPNLRTLTLKDAMQLNIFEGPFPDSLHTLVVSGLSHNFEFAFIDKIPNLKTISREYVNFYMLTNQVPKGFIQASERLKRSLGALDVHAVIKTDSNYIGTKEIDVEHITHLTCSGTKAKLRLIGREYVGLKSLSFDIIQGSDEIDHCFFGHEVIAGFNRLNSLIFNERSHEINKELCEECFEALLDSFKNVNELTMHTVLNRKLVNLIFSKMEKVQKVSLFTNNKEILCDFDLESLPKLVDLKLWSNSNGSISDEVWMKWPSVPNLRNLEISLPLKNIQPATWLRFCQQCPSLVKFNHNCQKYCINDTILVLITKLLPKLQHLSLLSAHKLTPISFISIRNNCSALKSLKLGRNWIDTGLMNSLFTNLQRLQYLEWTDAQTYVQLDRTRVDFYEASNLTKVMKKCQSNVKEQDEESDTSSSDDETEKKVWGWIPKKGWGFWTKNQIKRVELEPEFDERY